MDATNILKNLGESLGDYAVAKNLEEIGTTLDNLANKTEDPTKRLAYRIASTKVLEVALEWMVSAEEKLPIKKDEAE